MNALDPFSVLAEPARRRLLEVMQHGPQNVGNLVTQTGISQPVVSKHLRILREANFVSVTPQGQQRVYALNAESFMTMDSWLQPYRQLWAERLDQLETFLDQPQGKTHA